MQGESQSQPYDRQELLDKIDNLQRQVNELLANEKVEKQVKHCQNCSIRDEEIEKLQLKVEDLQLQNDKQKQQIEQLQQQLQLQQDDILAKTKQIEELQEQPIVKQASQQTSMIYQHSIESREESLNGANKQQNSSININQISGINISGVEQPAPIQQVQIPKSQKRIVFNEFIKMKNRPEINSSIYSKGSRKQGKMLSLD